MTEHEARLLQLAEAKKPCPAVHSIEGLCGEHLCNGTGEVPLLPDTVREICPAPYRCGGTGIFHGYPCLKCGGIVPPWVETADRPIQQTGEWAKGRGWNPSHDPMAWVAAIAQVLVPLLDKDAWRYQNLAARLMDGDFVGYLEAAEMGLVAAELLVAATEEFPRHGPNWTVV